MASTAANQGGGGMDRSRADHHPSNQTMGTKSMGLSEQQMDEKIRKEDLEFGTRPQIEKLLGPITDMTAYKVDERALDVPELESNPIFQKLKQRILKFFVIREEERRYGLTEKQQNMNHKAGIDFSYWI